MYLSSLLSGGPLPLVDHPSKAQSIFQHSVYFHNFNTLPSSCSLRDQAIESGVLLIILVPVLVYGPFPLNRWAGLSLKPEREAR